MLIIEKFSVLPPSLQKQTSISGSISLPALSALLVEKSSLDPHKLKASSDVTDGKEVDKTSTYTQQRRPSAQLEHLIEKTYLHNNEALLEEKRLEEEQKLKEYREASKEVSTFTW